jgi:hypothetical protein
MNFQSLNWNLNQKEKEKNFYINLGQWVESGHAAQRAQCVWPTRAIMRTSSTTTCGRLALNL